MSAIEEFLQTFPYADMALLERLSEEIQKEKPHLAFISRFVKNITSGKYINEPIQLIRSIMKVVIPDDEDEKTLVVFTYLHPIIGLLVAPVVLHDFADENAFNEFAYIAKHVYLKNYDLICYSIDLLLSLKKHKNQALEALRFFAMAIGKLGDELTLLASSEDRFNEGLKLIDCGIKASKAVGDENSLLLLLKSKGDLMSLFDKKRDAIENYEEIVKKLKGSKNIRNMLFLQKVYIKLIDNLLEIGDANKALDYLDELDRMSSKVRGLGLSSKQDLAIIYYYRGKAYRLLGKLKDAKKALEKANRMASPSNYEFKKKIVEELILVYESLGKKDKIEKLLRE